MNLIYYKIMNQVNNRNQIKNFYIQKWGPKRIYNHLYILIKFCRRKYTTLTNSFQVKTD